MVNSVFLRLQEVFRQFSSEQSHSCSSAIWNSGQTRLKR